ncbi:hypothetical protein B0H15DRAFT_802521 [Mycena belliarum]|uniref:Uncharacterized protein n=1 Tax=Mycena belliarum TaxID=1033014 RepID=A0AAD6U3I0_9AGAR|nr:hypothetical protein B0H15DRAFT_802521 [Mycena belliae]
MYPTWPDNLTSLATVLAFLREPSTPALLGADLDRDFFPPNRNHYAPDVTAYCNADRTPFYFYVLGQVSGPVAFVDLQRRVRINAGGRGSLADQWFVQQLKPIESAIKLDEDEDYAAARRMEVQTCTDADGDLGSDGTYVELLVDYLGGGRCTVHTAHPATGELVASVPELSKDWPLRTGDWVLVLATMHKRCSYVFEFRDYDILARHIRVLQFDDGVTEPVLGERPSSFTGAAASDNVVAADTVYDDTVSDSTLTDESVSPRGAATAGDSAVTLAFPAALPSLSQGDARAKRARTRGESKGGPVKRAKTHD